MKRGTSVAFAAIAFTVLPLALGACGDGAPEDLLDPMGEQLTELTAAGPAVQVGWAERVVAGSVEAAPGLEVRIVSKLGLDERSLVSALDPVPDAVLSRGPMAERRMLIEMAFLAEPTESPTAVRGDQGVGHLKIEARCHAQKRFCYFWILERVIDLIGPDPEAGTPRVLELRIE